MGVTIYDVAEAAGVSASTVSRTFSRPDRVSYATAEKVRAAARELGYGGTLATRDDTQLGTNNLGIVVADINNPFFTAVIRGAEHAALTQRMTVLVANTNESLPRARSSIEALIPHVDAILLASTRLAVGEIQKIARRLPTVVVNRPVSGVPSVLVDNYEGVMKAVIHLESQGARSIAYLSGPAYAWADSIRWRGLLDAASSSRPDYPAGSLTRTQALAQQLPPLGVSHITTSSPDVVGGRRAFEAWKEKPTDAVICFNDLCAQGFIIQAQLEGTRVPEDVLVVGFDNAGLAPLVSPSITTVAAPLASLGRVAAANAIALARGIKAGMTKPRLLPTRLIVRESTLSR